jgi:probable addiction module antidote protein
VYELRFPFGPGYRVYFGEDGDTVVEEGYFRHHPEEIDPYLSEIFEAFAKDGNPGALLASLRTIARIKGMSSIAEETGMTRQGLQKALSANIRVHPKQYGLL